MVDHKEALDKLRQLKILFVDDEQNMLDIMTDLLDDLKVEYVTAVDGQDALDKVRADNSIDLIVSDYYMPNMNGMEMLEVLRSEGNDIGFIFVSGHQSMDLFDKADDLCALDYLYKPFDFSDFIEIIGNLELK